MRTSAQIEHYVRKSVPLSQKMGVRVKSLNQKGLELKLPLAPNHNHLGTAFGGTLIAAQALACWAWLTWKLEREGLDFHIVIKNCTNEFSAAVDKNFLARCTGLSESKFKSVVQQLRRHGRASLILKAQISVGRKLCCEFQGKYVVRA